MGEECERLDCSVRGEAVSAATGGTCLRGGRGQEAGSLARRMHQNVPFLARSGLSGEGVSGSWFFPPQQGGRAEDGGRRASAL